VGGTWGTLRAGGAAALFLPVLPFRLLVGALAVLAAGVCCAELDPFEPSGGIDALELDKRR
jgi:hypothetical protein